MERQVVKTDKASNLDRTGHGGKLAHEGAAQFFVVPISTVTSFLATDFEPQLDGKPVSPATTSAP